MARFRVLVLLLGSVLLAGCSYLDVVMVQNGCDRAVTVVAALNGMPRGYEPRAGAVIPAGATEELYAGYLEDGQRVRLTAVDADFDATIVALAGKVARTGFARIEGSACAAIGERSRVTVIATPRYGDHAPAKIDIYAHPAEIGIGLEAVLGSVGSEPENIASSATTSVVTLADDDLPLVSDFTAAVGRRMVDAGVADADVWACEEDGRCLTWDGNTLGEIPLGAVADFGVYEIPPDPVVTFFLLVFLAGFVAAVWIMIRWYVDRRRSLRAEGS